MILSVTGHRPQKLGGFKAKSFHSKIIKAMEKEILTLSPNLLLSGMALGVDQWAAEICIKHNIPFKACLPFRGQESAWPLSSVHHYNWLLKRAAQVVEVDRMIGYKIGHIPVGVYDRRKLTRRNHYLVDNSDAVLGVFVAGNQSGAYTTWCYATSKPNYGVYRVDLSAIDPEYKDVVKESSGNYSTFDDMDDVPF